MNDLWIKWACFLLWKSLGLACFNNQQFIGQLFKEEIVNNFYFKFILEVISEITFYIIGAARCNLRCAFYLHKLYIFALIWDFIGGSYLIILINFIFLSLTFVCTTVNSTKKNGVNESHSFFSFLLPPHRTYPPLG